MVHLPCLYQEPISTVKQRQGHNLAAVVSTSLFHAIVRCWMLLGAALRHLWAPACTCTMMHPCYCYCCPPPPPPPSSFFYVINLI